SAAMPRVSPMRARSAIACAYWARAVVTSPRSSRTEANVPIAFAATGTSPIASANVRARSKYDSALSSCRVVERAAPMLPRTEAIAAASPPVAPSFRQRALTEASGARADAACRPLPIERRGLQEGMASPARDRHQRKLGQRRARPTVPPDARVHTPHIGLAGDERDGVG